MSFMIKKKRYKFSVDLSLDELTEVTYSKGIFIAKVRQLDGGSFTELSKRMEVQNHIVNYQARFNFPCKMFASASSGILESCKCRISIRMEEKGGKRFRKLGFADINLSEYAGAGPSTHRYILQGYDQSHRLDNSMIQVTLNITLKEGDTIFQRPLTRTQPIALPGEEDVPNSSDSVTDLVNIPVSGTPLGLTADPDDGSHTRNSSEASQGSAGYNSGPPSGSLPLPSIHSVQPTYNPIVTGIISNSVPGNAHSRQSSSGDSSHGRNLSQGSSDTGFFGSMEKEKNRRKKLDEGRVDPESVINELMEGVDLDKVAQDDAETSGLQLFVGKDGTVTFDKSSSRKDFEPVVITANNYKSNTNPPPAI